MGLRLNREALRVVGKNDKGTVTHRRRFKKGDKLDKASLDILGDDRVQHFLDRGVLVDEDATEDTDGPEQGQEAPDGSEGSGDGTGEAGGGSEPETDEPDRYDEMSYADLQAEAKERTGNGGGSADDLRARLREQDTLEADDED